MKLLALRKLHRWVALIVGLQVVLWAAGGVAFAWLDEAAVAGERVASRPARVPLSPDERVVEPAALDLAGPAVDAVVLQRVNGLWTWRIEQDGRVELRRARDGVRYAIGEDTARELASAAYRGEGRLLDVRLNRDSTLETRGAGPTWQATFDDASGTRLYFAADDGRFVAARTDTWRLRDVLWMLHTMDYAGRDDFNHPLVVVAALAAVWVGLTGAWLLVRVFRRR
jgi:hypothetical protein